MSIFREKCKNLFWSLPGINSEKKEYLYFLLKRLWRNNNSSKMLGKDKEKEYIQNILSIQQQSKLYESVAPQMYSRQNGDLKLLAYYLPQFYPTPYNDEWWGKGATEWRNVTKSIPQYVGQYQPRLPGELGFYDLRLFDNIKRQIELAQRFGIYGFVFYYYWFDGTRLLFDPIKLFFKNNIQFPVCFCWVNENWTKRWFGTSEEILIKLTDSKKIYEAFIKDVAPYLKDHRYMLINGKKVLMVYRPEHIPEIQAVLEFWRNYVKEKTGYELYLIAVMNNSYKNFEEADYISKGFDAISEFFYGPHEKQMQRIDQEKDFVCQNFIGRVYDYKDFVANKRYFTESMPHVFRAIAPMWDNTARRANNGTIFDGATPQLYEEWLTDIGVETNERVCKGDLDDNLIFINAWNEWGEGAYLEPDMKWGYAYLNATERAVLRVRRHTKMENIK